jgi:glycosyltransferase involved in cell wall biosynthesis
LRPYLPWLKKWRFVYESHDLETGRLGANTHNDDRLRRALRAMQRFDVVVAITKALAEDIREASRGAVRPHVVTMASGLPRLESVPQVNLQRGRPIVLGYVGTIDQMRGVEVLLEALPLIAGDVKLRLIGRVRDSVDGRLPGWLAALLARPEIGSRVEVCEPVPYGAVAEKLDQADILVLPAGSNQHYSRYASPLKLFDYMMRGKPIVAAGVDGLREILTDRQNAILYEPDSPASAARAISELMNCSRLASSIATAAWRDSEAYTYESRARRILDLAERE